MNRFIGKGRLANDPELRTTPSGTTVCNFPVAIDRKFKREGEPTADFFNCVAFSNRAEFISKYFKKGQEILFDGNVQIRKWQDKEGGNRYATEIFIDNAEFCGSKADNGSSSEPPVSQPTTAAPFIPADDDDLPF